MGYRVRHGICLYALLSASATLCGAQQTQPVGGPVAGAEVARPELGVPKQPRILCGSDQLEISADDSTLSSILNLVGACLGVPMQLPAGSADERTFLKVGPGSPREVLNTLLNSTDLNFVIQESKSRPGKVMAVILTDRAQDATDGKDPLAGGLVMTPARRLWLSSRDAARPAGSDSNVELDRSAAAVAPAASEARPVASIDGAVAATDNTKPTQVGEANALPAVPVEAPRGVSAEASKPATDEGPLRTQINQMQQMFEQRRKLNTPAPAAAAPQ